MDGQYTHVGRTYCKSDIHYSIINIHPYLKIGTSRHRKGKQNISR